MNKEKEGRIWKAIFEKRSKKKQETIVSQKPYRRWVLRKKEWEDRSQWNFGREVRMSLKPAYGLNGKIWRKALQMEEQPKQDFRGGGCGEAKSSRRSGHHLSSAQQWSHPHCTGTSAPPNMLRSTALPTPLFLLPLHPYGRCVFSHEQAPSLYMVNKSVIDVCHIYNYTTQEHKKYDVI